MYKSPLENIIKRGNNNFDLVRLIAALLVIWGHSFDLFETPNYIDPVKKILVIDSPGTIAVYVFFFLSGVFITASMDNSTKTHFIVMRLVRIWPALIICTFSVVFIIGSLFTNLTLYEYLEKRSTWTFLICNSIIYNIKWYLPGVFENNHHPNVVNGQLWTLPVEVECYTTIFILGLSKILKNKYAVTIFYILVFALYISNSGRILYFEPLKQVVFFYSGTLVYIFRKYIELDLRIGLAFIFSCFGLYNTIFFFPIFYITLIYNMLLFGASRSVLKIKLPGDYSYGIYIYGYVIQQSCAHLIPHITAYESLIITIPLTLLFAIISWNLVEKPAILLGKKISKRPIMTSS